jgi:hypothetical protein
LTWLYVQQGSSSQELTRKTEQQACNQTSAKCLNDVPEKDKQPSGDMTVFSLSWRAAIESWPEITVKFSLVALVARSSTVQVVVAKPSPSGREWHTRA